MAVLNRIQVDGAAYDINAIYAENAGSAINADNATNASLSSTANIAKNSNALGGQGISYFAKASDIEIPPYLYSAVFYLTNWSGSGPYTQTATLTAEDGGPSVTSSSKFFSSSMCEQTLNQDTNEKLQEILGIINSGYLTLKNNSITASVFNKPDADIKIFWLLKRGGS